MTESRQSTTAKQYITVDNSIILLYTVCRRKTYILRRGGGEYKENEDNKMIESSEEKNLIIFCKTPRTRNEICHYLGINSVSYVMKKYVMPLVERGILKMSIPDKPKSTKQLFYCE